MIRLVGILLVIVGFRLRWNTLLVVLGAGLVTGLSAGLGWDQTVSLLGKYFLDNRYLTLPVILVLPVVGVLEQHGLRERAESLLRANRAATAGRVILLFMAVRQVAISLGVSIGGHAAAVRPLVAPMAEGAARARHGPIPAGAVQRIRALAAAAENLGNFFGEDIFVAVGAVLLMKGFFDGEKIAVSVWALALWGLPTAVVALGAMAWRTRALDASLRRGAAGPGAAAGGSAPGAAP